MIVLAAGDGSNTSALVVLLVGLALLWVASVARRRRLARVCDRWGHAPDPTTVGTRGETCTRCGTRLR